MQRPSGTAAVRLSLWMLLVASFAMAMTPPVHAGTEAAPEIQDAQGDIEILVAPGCIPDNPGTGPGAFCPTGNAIDILTVWIDNETATDLQFHIRGNGAMGGASQQGQATGADTFTLTFTVAGTEYTGSATMVAGADPTVAGAVTGATFAETLLNLVVAKSGIGNPTTGAALEGLTVSAERLVDPFPLPLVSDEAAVAEGTTYTFTGGGSGPGPCPTCTADDTDGDGLNDTWEQQYFGNLDQNATGDPDEDGLTNGQEEALGTDPTEADTDGDGTNDKEDSAPTDPTRGGTSSSSSSTTSSSTGPPTSSSTSRSTTSGGIQQGEDDDGDVENLDDAVEQLRSDPAYLGLSGGGFLAVLILCILALAVRWSL